MPLPPGPQSPDMQLAIKAWNMLQVPGVDVPLVADVLGIEDVDVLIEQLRVIREFKANG